MVRLGAPDVTTEERTAFEAWVTFPGNRAAYIECRELTPMSGLLRSQPEAAPDLLERIRALKCASAPRQRRAWYLPVMLAASLIPVIVGLVRQMGSPEQAASVQSPPRSRAALLGTRRRLGRLAEHRQHDRLPLYRARAPRGARAWRGVLRRALGSGASLRGRRRQVRGARGRHPVQRPPWRGPGSR